MCHYHNRFIKKRTGAVIMPRDPAVSCASLLPPFAVILPPIMLASLYKSCISTSQWSKLSEISRYRNLARK